MVKKITLFTVSLLSSYWIIAQKDSLILENSSVARVLRFSKDSTGFYSVAFINKKSSQNYVNPDTEEFSININDSTWMEEIVIIKTHFFRRAEATQSLTVVLETPFPNVIFNYYMSFIKTCRWCGNNYLWSMKVETT
jgi:hypothetical protein